jgi:hypothetical protein
MDRPECCGARISRALRWWVCALLCASLPSARGDLVFDLTTVGNPGNAADDTGLGAVGYTYSISTYEVTVAQYTEFLNAVAASDPYALYNPIMGTTAFGGPFLTQSGSDGSYTYSAVSGKEDQPVRLVSLYDTMRFCNWLSNGQGSGSTETGSYDMAVGLWVERESSATWVLPSEDEWYKAAYYDPDTGTYYDYPNGTDDVPAEPTDGTSPRVFNFGDTPFWQGTVVFTDMGDTTGQSPYGTYDQGGNVYEWTDTIPAPLQGPQRAMMGGHFSSPATGLEASATPPGYLPHIEGESFGFRVAYVIPEPSTFLMLTLGGIGLLLHGRNHNQSFR